MDAANREAGMDGEQLQRVAAARALELPGGKLTRPFGPTWDVYKVAGRG